MKTAAWEPTDPDQERWKRVRATIPEGLTRFPRSMDMSRPRTTIPTRPADARAQRSIEAMGAALLELIDRKPIDEVTIKEITDTAELSYPTFFRRFESKEELLEYIAMEEVRRLLGLGQSAFEGGRPKRSGKALCDYVQAHRKMWKTLLTGGAAAAMRREFMRVAEEIAASGPRANPWIPIDLAVPFVTSAIFELLAWWMRQPDDYPVDNVIKLFDALIVDAVARPRDIHLV